MKALHLKKPVPGVETGTRGFNLPLRYLRKFRARNCLEISHIQLYALQKLDTKTLMYKRGVINKEYTFFF